MMSKNGSSAQVESDSASVGREREFTAVRNQARTLALAAFGSAVVAIIVGLIGRKKQGPPPFAAIAACSVLAVLLVVYMQATASVL